MNNVSGGRFFGTARLLWVCLVLGSPAVLAEWQRDEQDIMGTRVTVELFAADANSGREHIDSVFAEFRRLDQMMNPWNPSSELSRINRDAAGDVLVTSPEIVEVLVRALKYSQMSDGAFDVSFASVGQHYDYRDGKAPSQNQVEEGLDEIDYRAIQLDPERRRIHFLKPGMQLDLGGIAKGYAVDRAVAMLYRAGVREAIISAGGDSRILGGMENRPRTIGIRHPRKDGEYVALIPLADTAISTSGDYERFFMDGDVRVHHILDPVTGKSADRVQSASVLAPQAIDSDALSTAVFVLGVESGLALINDLPGVDAIIIDGAGKLHYSDDLLRSVASE
ncbi:MAG: FAD:protein FMN transferase [Pseudomonadota bacterium]